MNSALVFGLILFYTIASQALVDMNNATYSNTWIDLQSPSTGYELRVLRTYKSRTLYDGIFGFGWCSEFETKLSLLPEGGIKVSECGDGLETYYSTKPITKENIEAAVQKIIKKIKNKSPSLSDSYLKELTANLRKDANLREKYALDNDIISPVPKDTKLMANGNETEYIIQEKNYYSRHLSDGSSQRFDLFGKLTRIYNKNGQYLKFNYTENKLTEIEDDSARKLIFKYFPSGKVQKISGPNNLTTEYSYNSNNDLIWNKNASAKSDRDVHTYDYNEYHNLVKATWPDQTFITLKYDNQKDWVIAFSDREKCTETYKYEASKDEPQLHYWATNTKSCNDEVILTNRYEFWHKYKENGEPALIRSLTLINKDTKDTTYDEKTAKPIRVIFNEQTTEYTYYPDGLVKTKSTPLTRQEMSYDSVHKKISKIVSTTYNENKKIISKETSIFKYDKKANLIYAENSNGKKMNLSYDFNGRIKSILDNDKIKINIQYEDKFGKPSVVTREGQGSISITYTATGEIDKVESEKGAKTATLIAGTFNSFLEIIAPVNQSLY